MQILLHCQQLHTGIQAQAFSLTMAISVGESGQARTRNTRAHLARIFAVALLSVQSIEAVPLRLEAAQPLENMCVCLLPFSGFCVLATCHWNEWLSNCLKSEMALLYNFRTRELLLIFLNWLRHLSVIWRGNFVTYVVIQVLKKQVHYNSYFSLAENVSTKTIISL